MRLLIQNMRHEMKSHHTRRSKRRSNVSFTSWRQSQDFSSRHVKVSSLLWAVSVLCLEGKNNRNALCTEHKREVLTEPPIAIGSCNSRLRLWDEPTIKKKSTFLLFGIKTSKFSVDLLIPRSPKISSTSLKPRSFPLSLWDYALSSVFAVHSMFIHPRLNCVCGIPQMRNQYLWKHVFPLLWYWFNFKFSLLPPWPNCCQEIALPQHYESITYCPKCPLKHRPVEIVRHAQVRLAVMSQESLSP